MVTENKVLVLPNICGVEIDLSATLQPSIDNSLQPFYNTLVQNSDPKKVYATPSKITFSESGKESRAGFPYEQKLKLEFPSNDPYRAKRIADYQKVKYLYIKLSSGMVFFFGRNDYYQNTEPKVSVASNGKTSQITYTTQSISPIGFTNGSFDFGLPEDFPVNFYNL